MPTFEIQYGEFGYDASRSAGFHYFDVRCGSDEERIAVGLSDEVRRRWDLGDRANGKEIEHRIILRYLKEHLAGITALAFHRVLLTLWEGPTSGEDWTVQRVPQDMPYEWKECKHQDTRAGERLCGAAREGDRIEGRTTLALCEACGLPSTDIICDNLVSVRTRGVGTSVPGVFKRGVESAECDIGSGEFGKPARDPELCVPGGRGCWVQTYEPEQPAVGAEPGERNLAAEALDMVDTLNTIFRDQFDAEIFRLKQFRTGRVLMEPCTSEEGFAFKLQVLGDLIDLMNSKQLGEAQGVTCEPGSVNSLAAFLEKVVQGDAAPVIQTLRDIRTVRKQIAAHSAAAADFVEACRRLGIDLPITDWEDAWHRLVSAFLEALRRLQGLLP